MSTSSRVTSDFAKEFSSFESANSAELEAVSKHLTPGDHDDLFWELIADLKDMLGVRAANQLIQPAAQERAIDECSQWVADVYSGRPCLVPLAFWMRGPREAERLLLCD
jgi:hypothetical protein